MDKVPQKMTAAQISGLAAMMLGTLVICNDFTALNVALPAIEKTFHVDVTTAQWVITGYVLVFGVSVVTAGRLADMFGRRRIFFIGMTIFALFSLIGAMATDVWVLLVARGVMGIGGAMVWPAMLGITFSLVPEDKAALAGGLILGFAGIGNAMGPMLGGVFTEYLSWRWIFYINVPVAIIAILVTLSVVPKDQTEDIEKTVDYPGIITLSLGLFALLLVLDVGAGLGWFSPAIFGLLGLSVVAICSFFMVERRAGPGALVPKAIRENSAFKTSIAVILTINVIYFASLFYLPQFMVKVLKFSAAQAGVGLLPILAMFAVTSFIAGPLYGRLGPKLMVTIGSACLSLGILILAFLDASTTYVGLVPGMMILGVGLGFFFSSITTVGITSVDPSQSSLAGAILYMFQNAGGAIGLGLNTAVVVSAPTLVEGIRRAFIMDAVLGAVGVVICLTLVDGPITAARIAAFFRREKEDES
ncbi:MFS transporter [Sneathiella marina]|uniref:MFS transporter n=1 Tax=Sneathiella marina TaxID=2950108 RepID=A0ABY4W175_9PROT|nr:MFS transporter [Sneathiella marina]USG60913.1 MFS transporter [Sneathiella marina]